MPSKSITPESEATTLPEVTDVVRFPEPVDSREYCDYEWDHDRYPFEHWYRPEEIVITRDRGWFRWHLPHGATGVDRSIRSAYNRARRVIDYALDVGHYGASVWAARRYGNSSRTVCDLAQGESGWLNMSEPLLMTLVSRGLREIRGRFGRADGLDIMTRISQLPDQYVADGPKLTLMALWSMAPASHQISGLGCTVQAEHLRGVPPVQTLMAELAERRGCSVRKVRRHLQELKSLALIEVDGRSVTLAGLGGSGRVEP